MTTARQEKPSVPTPDASPVDVARSLLASHPDAEVKLVARECIQLAEAWAESLPSIDYMCATLDARLECVPPSMRGQRWAGFEITTDCDGFEEDACGHELPADPLDAELERITAKREPYGPFTGGEMDEDTRTAGLLADVCDIAFEDDTRAEVHGYAGVLDRVRGLAAAARCLKPIEDRITAWVHWAESVVPGGYEMSDGRMRTWLQVELDSIRGKHPAEPPAPSPAAGAVALAADGPANGPGGEWFLVSWNRGAEGVYTYARWQHPTGAGVKFVAGVSAFAWWPTLANGLALNAVETAAEAARLALGTAPAVVRGDGACPACDQGDAIQAQEVMGLAMSQLTGIWTDDQRCEISDAISAATLPVLHRLAQLEAAAGKKAGA